MKHDFLTPVVLPLAVSLFATCFVVSSHAQKPTYKCDNNHYTDTLTDPKAKGCKALEGGNVTIVQGTRPAAAANQPVKLAAATQAGQRVDSGDQRSRDSDARQILESELKKAEARQAELAREYNNGEPDKQGGEARNYQKYIDRVAELKAGLARNESDIAGIRRELGRAGGAPSAVGASGAK